MKGKKRMRSILILKLLAAPFILTIALAPVASAATVEPWETCELSAGLFLTELNTSFRLGAGIGLDIDAEDLLDLDTSSIAFRASGLWRFSRNHRHRIDLSWFALHRRASKTVTEDFEYELPDGTIVPVEAGTAVAAHFNIDIYQLAYSYSFLQDDRIDFAASFGLYVMPFDIGLSTTGALQSETTSDFIAPLPVLGLRMDIALTPRWYFRSMTQVFYLKYDQFQGSLLNASSAIEYRRWAHAAVGLSLDKFNIMVQADGEDYPMIDFSGKAELEYSGVQLYARFFF